MQLWRGKKRKSAESCFLYPDMDHLDQKKQVLPWAQTWQPPASRRTLAAGWAAEEPLPDALFNKTLVRLMPDRRSLGNEIVQLRLRCHLLMQQGLCRGHSGRVGPRGWPAIVYIQGPSLGVQTACPH